MFNVYFNVYFQLFNGIHISYDIYIYIHYSTILQTILQQQTYNSNEVQRSTRFYVRPETDDLRL